MVWYWNLSCHVFFSEGIEESVISISVSSVSFTEKLRIIVVNQVQITTHRVYVRLVNFGVVKDAGSLSEKTICSCNGTESL